MSGDSSRDEAEHAVTLFLNARDVKSLTSAAEAYGYDDWRHFTHGLITAACSAIGSGPDSIESERLEALLNVLDRPLVHPTRR